jgi:hypothetical protein
MPVLLEKDIAFSLCVITRNDRPGFLTSLRDTTSDTDSEQVDIGQKTASCLPLQPRQEFFGNILPIQ